MPDFNPASIVRVLNSHHVKFVVIGGVAAQLHDLPVPATVDIDVTPSRQRDNLERLATAFDDLDAGLYGRDGSATWFPRSPIENWAQYSSLHLMTRYGPLDIVFAPDGAPRGFDDLDELAEPSALDGEAVRIVTTSTWVALKEAAGRQKDLEHLDRYYQHRKP